jgi:hypothetical protein
LESTLSVLAQVAGSNPSVPKRKIMYTGKEVTWEREREKGERQSQSAKAKGMRAQGEKQKAKARYTHTGWTIVILKKTLLFFVRTVRN